MTNVHHFHSEGLELVAHLEMPESTDEILPGVLLVHGFPEGPGGGANSAGTLPELANRISSEMGFISMAPLLRGTGESEGCFSLAGWLTDVRQAVSELNNHPRVGQIWLVGFGSGGAISICAAALEANVKGVGALAAPADWAAWAASPKRLLIHARRAGVILDPNFPKDFDSWAAELKQISAETAIAKLNDKSVLIVHGTEDDVVSSLEARALSDAHGNTDMRLIEGAGHHLRHDPRAIAVLLGWLDRQRRTGKLET
jgi:putative redox protein